MLYLTLHQATAKIRDCKDVFFDKAFNQNIGIASDVFLKDKDQ